MKRFWDVVFSSILLIILSPLFLIISIMIKVTSKGPVFFKQRRIGKDNNEFMIYKFRTMKVDTPDLATDKLVNAKSYITSIGNILRKTSLDELPQLINIFKGEMTFIGPRPALYNQYELIKLRTNAGVHALVPGVTGWAQINGRDHNDNFQKTELDRYYLDNKSSLLDLKILFMTVFKVLRCEGVIEGTANKNRNESIQVQNKESIS